MHRSAFGRSPRFWQIALWLILLGALATASVGGAQAQGSEQAQAATPT